MGGFLMLKINERKGGTATMSDISEARRTTVEIAFGGTDITSSIKPYFLSMSYTDNEEDEADDLQLKLQDRGDEWIGAWLDDIIKTAVEPDADADDDADDQAPNEAAQERTSTQSTSYSVTARSGLNVRSGPGTNNSILTTLQCGTSVVVLGIQNGWANIQYNGADAYVYAAYLRKNAAAPVVTTVSSGSPGDVGEGAGDYTVKSKKGAIVRSQPGATTKQSKLGTLEYGAKIKVLSIADGWARFEYNGQTAYISKGGISKDIPPENPGSLRLQAVIVRKNWNGDGQDQTLDCGEFTIDSVAASGPPSIATIKATSLPYLASVRKVTANKVWEKYTLFGIAREIAANNGMLFMYESKNSPFYERREQLNTSDIDFLSALCHDAGLSLKATNNILVLFDQADYEAKPVVTAIKRKSGSYISYKLSTGKAGCAYASCRVSYADPIEKQTIEGIAYRNDYDPEDEDNQRLEIKAKVKTAEEAEALAEKQLRLYNKHERTASFTMPGNTELVAGLAVQLSGFGPWDGKYIISQAKHSVDGSGYITKINLRWALSAVSPKKK